MYDTFAPPARRTGFADPLTTSFGSAPLYAAPAPYAAELLSMVSNVPHRDGIIEQMLVPPTFAAFGLSKNGVYGAMQAPSSSGGAALAFGLGALLGIAGTALYFGLQAEPSPGGG